MTHPYFAVGEEVVSVGNTIPEANGEKTVSDVHVDVYQGRDIDCKCCGVNIAYELDDNEFIYCQCALRKKPEPGGDYKTFMDSLPNPLEVCP